VLLILRVGEQNERKGGRGGGVQVNPRNIKVTTLFRGVKRGIKTGLMYQSTVLSLNFEVITATWWAEISQQLREQRRDHPAEKGNRRRHLTFKYLKKRVVERTSG